MKENQRKMKSNEMTNQKEMNCQNQKQTFVGRCVLVLDFVIDTVGYFILTAMHCIDILNRIAIGSGRVPFRCGFLCCPLWFGDKWICQCLEMECRNILN